MIVTYNCQNIFIVQAKCGNLCNLLRTSNGHYFDKAALWKKAKGQCYKTFYVRYEFS